jgi:hypothetical protein
VDQQGKEEAWKTNQGLQMMYKLSSTAAIRAFKRGALSLAGLKSASKYTGKTMRISHISSGTSQHASRVVHPRLGQVTMKMPLKVTKKPTLREGRIPVKALGVERTALRNT